MIKKLILCLLISSNIYGMQKLILRCSRIQMHKISIAMTSERYGLSIKNVLNSTIRSIVADKDRKAYTFTFDLEPEYIGTTFAKQRESLTELFDHITSDSIKEPIAKVSYDKYDEPLNEGHVIGS